MSRGGGGVTLSDLDRAFVAEALQTRVYGRSLEIRPTVGSTNDLAREVAERGGATGHVIVAERQTAGRGQHGRPWFSPAGGSLYLSIVDRPQLSGKILPMITLAVGLGVAETLDTYLPTGCRTQIKWPNDVRFLERKMAGVLVESASGRQGPGRDRPDWVVIGIGLNVHRRSWPEELQTQATALADLATVPIDRAILLARLLERVESRVRALEGEDAGALITDLQPRLEWRGQEVRCGPVRGRLMGLSPVGALRLATPEGERRVVSGPLEPLG